MAEEQKKKKVSAKGRKVKKGSPAKRSLFFKPATMILSLLAILLFALGIIYLARVQHWFPSATFTTATKKEVHKPPVTKPLKSEVVSEEKGKDGLAESYNDIPRQQRQDHETLLGEEGPLVAIIVDDLGADLGMMQEFLHIPLNLTASVLPNVPHARESAELAHAAGHEVLLHIPMEPQNYPTANPGVNPLMVDLAAEEVQQRLRDYLRAVPWATGANNHMGSRFTESREGMRGVLQILKDQGMFFVDSLTTADSVAISEAEQMLMAHAERDLFLDNVQSEAAIRQQIHKLIKIAKAQGSAIGICHPHVATYVALKKEASIFAESGVRLVPVSALVHEMEN